jgi:hypothetical protein
MPMQVQALGQKYMGMSGSSHLDDVFRAHNHADANKGHPVPVSNFLNAQCKLPSNTMQAT